VLGSDHLLREFEYRHAPGPEEVVDEGVQIPDFEHDRLHLLVLHLNL
jgi:hypothetical protein